ncbi:MAG: hypothetical protein IPM54_34560 [Polyangiaceae bacterium]|nr:hypothetical protein [Polyangiaceae bacterium]
MNTVKDPERNIGLPVAIVIGAVCFVPLAAVHAQTPPANQKPPAVANSSSAASSASASPPAASSSAPIATNVPSANTAPPAASSATPAGPPVTEKLDLGKTFVDAKCSDRLIFCMDNEGNLFQDDETIPKLVPDETLVIKVIGPNNKANFTRVSVNGVTSTDSLARASGGAGAEVVAPAVIAETTMTVTAKMLSLRVELRSKENADSDFISKRTFSIPVERGRYFVDLGLMVPVVIMGQRNYYANPLPGSSDRVISQVSDTMVKTALALNIYPGGHPQHAIKPNFSRPGDWIGLQIGIDLNISKPEQGYAGIIFEPISGFAIGGGVAAVKGLRLADTYETGMILQPGEAPPTQDTILFRGYLGVTLSTELVNLLRTSVSQFSGSSQ